jgi:hypothetical protein
MGGPHTKKTIAPTWFKLENYDRQSALDLPGWLLQLGVRRDLLAFIKGQIDDSAKTLEAGLATKIISWIHNDPILQWDKFLSEFDSCIPMIFPSLAPLYSSQPRNEMAVHPTTVEEWYRFEMSLHPEMRQHATKFYTQMQRNIEYPQGTQEYFEELDNRIKVRKTAPSLEESDSAEEPVPYASMMDHPIYCSSEDIHPSFFFTVNVSLPDKLLEAQFKDMVQRVRAYLASVASFPTHLPKEPAQDWADEQLLAYLDLSLEKYLRDGIYLSQADIASLIWPPDRPGNKGSDKGWDEEHLKSTTASIAIEMMDYCSDPFWTLQATVAAMLASPSLDLQPPDSLRATIRPPKTRRSRWKNK